MNRCGCNPVPEQLEFKIKNKQINFFKSTFPDLYPLNNNIQELKDKIVQEYLKIIDNLECGIQPNLEFLLEEISLVEIIENG